MIGSIDGVVIVVEDNLKEDRLGENKLGGDKFERNGVAINNGLAGFVAGTPDQKRLYRELRTRHLMAFGLASVIAAVRNPGWAFRLFRAIGRPGEAASMSSSACLMSLAVDPKCQASGIGSELVRQFESSLVQLGCRDYCLTTDREHNAPVRKFYERLGLSVVREITTREGRRMLEYYKRIAEY
jgi:ribosomal protein S18 acetylase RimI-like enzyme